MAQLLSDAISATRCLKPAGFAVKQMKDEIKRFATKDDLRVLESKLNMKIYVMAGTVVAALKALEHLGI